MAKARQSSAAATAESSDVSTEWTSCWFRCSALVSSSRCSASAHRARPLASLIRLRQGLALLLPPMLSGIGTDGMTAPIPDPSATLPQPDFPGINAIAAGAGEALDKNFRPDESDQFDLTIQRQINSKTMIEFGYIGRKISHEYQPININAVPTMMTLGGQIVRQSLRELGTAILRRRCGPFCRRLHG